MTSLPLVAMPPPASRQRCGQKARNTLKFGDPSRGATIKGDTVMFNPLTWLDGILLGAAQKLCDKVQRLTGLTKFRLEKWAVIMSVVFFWADAVSNPTGLIITANLYITFIMVVIV